VLVLGEVAFKNSGPKKHLLSFLNWFRYIQDIISNCARTTSFYIPPNSLFVNSYNIGVAESFLKSNKNIEISNVRNVVYVAAPKS